MTLPEILRQLETAAEQARERGASEAEVAAIRAEILAKHRKPGGDREPVNTWQPLLPADEKPPEPKRAPINPGRRTERKGDRF